ncbi:hypothetical protein BV25DRAFT_421073 [Artomyces pyxidatus]|uniref:Uncharacterized protein n=1 Tax=Artomyces pyxidatus TaxID=48021 RepID=A0ACB8T4B0_9AGAM|nr:hypothetical protein BV25DRAFT_421073 [Artomyces pyxidatus]
MAGPAFHRVNFLKSFPPTDVGPGPSIARNVSALGQLAEASGARARMRLRPGSKLMPVITLSLTFVIVVQWRAHLGLRVRHFRRAGCATSTPTGVPGLLRAAACRSMVLFAIGLLARDSEHSMSTKCCHRIPVALHVKVRLKGPAQRLWQVQQSLQTPTRPCPVAAGLTGLPFSSPVHLSRNI